MALGTASPPGGGVRPGVAGQEGRVTAALALAVVVGLAFNDLAGVLPAGELANDAVIYTFPLLLFWMLRRPAAIAAPVSLVVVVLAFVAAIAAGIVINHAAIASGYFKGRSGMGRVATQGLSLGLGLCFALVFYNLVGRGFLPVISRGARIAVVVMAGVGVLEIGSWAGLPGVSQLHQAISAVIHAGSGADYPARLRMTAFEVSWAGVMLTFLFPFALIGIEPRGWRLPALVIAVLVMMLLAQSRTALLVLGFQLAFLMATLVRRNFDWAVHALTLAVLACTLAVLAPQVRERVATVAGNLIEYGTPTARTDDLGDENASNVTRIAAIRAGLSMFQEQPLLGVGLGQYGFNYPSHLRAEDFRSWEVRKYATDAEEDWPPSYSIHVRLMAETGLIGYGLWLGLVLAALRRGLRGADLATQLGRGHLAVVLTLLGWLLLGVSIDSFRFFGGWIALGTAFALPANRRAA